MLDPWIIEEIRRREQEQLEHREQPALELPLDIPHYPVHEGHDGPFSKPADPDQERGVTVIDFSIP